MTGTSFLSLKMRQGGKYPTGATMRKTITLICKGPIHLKSFLNFILLHDQIFRSWTKLRTQEGVYHILETTDDLWIQGWLWLGETQTGNTKAGVLLADWIQSQTFLQIPELPTNTDQVRALSCHKYWSGLSIELSQSHSIIHSLSCHNFIQSLKE